MVSKILAEKTTTPPPPPPPRFSRHVHDSRITRGGVFLVSSDGDFRSGGDRVVATILGEAGTDLRSFLDRSSARLGINPTKHGLTYGIKSDGQWAAGLRLLGFPGVVNDGLVVLREGLISTNNGRSPHHTSSGS